MDSRPQPPHVTVSFKRGQFAAQQDSAVLKATAEIWAVDSRNPTVIEQITVTPPMAIATYGQMVGQEGYEPALGAQVLPNKDGRLRGNWRIKPYNPAQPSPAVLQIGVAAPHATFDQPLTLTFHFRKRGPKGYGGAVKVSRKLDSRSDDEQ